jgi:hypothetical protein
MFNLAPCEAKKDYEKLALDLTVGAAALFMISADGAHERQASIICFMFTGIKELVLKKPS